MKTRRNHPVAVSAVMLVVATSLLLTACSAGSASPKTAAAQNMDSAVSSVTIAVESQENASAESDGTDLGAAQKVLSDQKIIEWLSYRIETLEFDQSIQTLQALTEQLGGYIQESGVDGSGTLQKNDSRTAHYILWIPQEKLKVWKEESGTTGLILSVPSSSESITESCYDAEAHLSALNTQRGRLPELMKKADRMADIVELEKVPADVTYQIEQLTGTLHQYGSLVNYSIATVDLLEVNKAAIIDKTPVTLGEKVSYQFRQSLRWIGDTGEGAFVVAIDGLPILLLFAVAGSVAWLIVCRRKRHAKLSVPMSGVDDPDNPPQLLSQE